MGKFEVYYKYKHLKRGEKMALTRLYLENFTVFDKLEIEFSKESIYLLEKMELAKRTS